MDGPEPEQTVRRRSSVASQAAEEDTGDGPDPDEYGSNPPQRMHRSLPVRALWFTVGIISLGLGGLGIILPGEDIMGRIVHILCMFHRSPLTNLVSCGHLYIRAANHAIRPTRGIRLPPLIREIPQVAAALEAVRSYLGGVGGAPGTAIDEGQSRGSALHDCGFLGEYRILCGVLGLLVDVADTILGALCVAVCTFLIRLPVVPPHS